MNEKRILIVTQAVDLDDPILAFFHRWIEEFARQCTSVEVICLRSGRMSIPVNVSVHSLGKERKLGRFRYVLNFYRLIWRLRHTYDAVFVHMNPEYVVLGGILWRALGKPIGLWYVHKSVTLYLRLATLCATRVFTASPESFRLSTTKVLVTGHGIDTSFFTPDPSIERGAHWLSVGRLMPSKRHDVAIREAHEAHTRILIAGTGPEMERLQAYAKDINADVSFLGPLNQNQLRDEYRRAAKLIHRSDTGSVDKVVLEAAACGCPVDTSNPALAALPLSAQYVRDAHSLERLIPAIVRSLCVA